MELKTMKYYKTNLQKISLVREPTDIPRAKITCAQDGADYARKFYHEDITIYESFFMIMLNNANNTIGYVKISQGGIVGTVVDVRLVAKYAIDCLATSVLLVHNHPSGTLTPSQADKLITSKIKKGLELFEIRILDHIIITEESHYSFGEENIL